MSNVLDQSKQQQILALGRLGWTLSRIQQATGARRETVSGYLKTAGIPVRGRGRPSESKPKPAISGAQVSTDPGPSKPAISAAVSTDSSPPNPATRAEVSTDSGPIAARGPCVECERVRGVPRADRRGPRAWPQCRCHLARPGRWPRLFRTVCQCPAFRADAARHDVGGGPCRHHDRTGRRSAGRLWRRADGPPPEDGQVPAHAPLRPDAGGTRANRCGCWCGSPVRRRGPSCMSARFVGWHRIEDTD
jgi:hypothetical protein